MLKSCELSGCCAGGELCHENICIECLPEGAAADSSDQCCSGAAEKGICCGELGSSCANSGCCAKGHVCHDGNCVDCIFEGEPTVDGDLCCSIHAENGVCCGDPHESCANSGCCANDFLCRDGACIECLPEGEHSDDPTKCCSHEVNSEGICCGDIFGHCTTSQCCGNDQTCFNGECRDCDPIDGQCDSSPTCCEGQCCNHACTDTKNDPANCGSCGNQCSEGCCNGNCVNTNSDTHNCGACGVACTFPFLFCQEGQCGQICQDLTSCRNGIDPPPDIFCPSSTLCCGFCGLGVRSLICCPPCPNGTSACTCGDGTCCCGTCDFTNHVCTPN